MAAVAMAGDVLLSLLPLDAVAAAVADGMDTVTTDVSAVAKYICCCAVVNAGAATAAAATAAPTTAGALVSHSNRG